MGWIFGLLFNGLLVLIALGINQTNARFLLSGYNTMSVERRSHFDLKGYLKVFKKYFLALGLISSATWLILALLGHSDWVVLSTPGLLLISLPYLVIKGQQYDHNKGKFRWVGTIVGIASLLVALAFVLHIFTLGMGENEIVMSDHAIEIGGMYAESIPLDDVVEVTLVDEIPAMNLRTNGFAAAGYRKGYFRTTNGETVKLFVQSDHPPFIRLRTETQTYYWNTGKRPTTIVYDELSSRLNSFITRQ